MLALPVAAGAQQAGKVPRIGFLFYGSPGPSPELNAFRQGLRELGYIEGQNITIEYRSASGRLGQLPELAAELVRLKLDVIVTPGTPASVAAKQATTTVPIVFAGVADAVAAGLVADFARPRGNITGLTSISAELSRRDPFLPDPSGTRLTDPLLSSSSGPGLTCPARSDRIGARCHGSSAR